MPAEAGDVDLTIYNVVGSVGAPRVELVRWRLASTGWLGMAGTHEGQPVAAGVYLVRLRQGDQTRIRKMVKLE